MGRGPCSHESYDIPDAQGFVSPEGDGDLTVTGEGRFASGGVFDHGTHEEDGPGTWETLVLPRDIPAPRRPGERVAPDPAEQRRPVLM